MSWSIYVSVYTNLTKPALTETSDLCGNKEWEGEYNKKSVISIRKESSTRINL